MIDDARRRAVRRQASSSMRCSARGFAPLTSTGPTGRHHRAREGRRIPVLAVDVPSGVDGRYGRYVALVVKATRDRHVLPPKAGPSADAGARRYAASWRWPISACHPASRKRCATSIAPPHYENQHRRSGPTLFQHPMRLATNTRVGMPSSYPARRKQRGPHGSGPVAALRVGAGLVTVASPRAAVPVNAPHLTAIMLAPFAVPQGLCAHSFPIAARMRC